MNLVIAKVGWEERVKILQCEGSEEASLPRGWEHGRHAGVVVT